MFIFIFPSNLTLAAQSATISTTVEIVCRNDGPRKQPRGVGPAHPKGRHAPMIYQLEPAQFARVRPLVAGLDYHLSIQAVLDGTVTGEVWVDDVAAPRATYMVTPEGQY